jgi:hypothetical protein
MPLRGLLFKARSQSENHSRQIAPKTAIAPGRRPRNSSDPFSDSPLSPRDGLRPAVMEAEDDLDIPPQSRSLLSDPGSLDLEVMLRKWMVPALLSNPELHELLAVFPSFITSKQVPRFTVVKGKGKSSGAKALEEGNAGERGELKFGTGRMGVCVRVRDPGWEGGFWYRMKEWFKLLFS